MPAVPAAVVQDTVSRGELAAESQGLVSTFLEIRCGEHSGRGDGRSEDRRTPAGWGATEVSQGSKEKTQEAAKIWKAGRGGAAAQRVTGSSLGGTALCFHLRDPTA